MFDIYGFSPRCSYAVVSTECCVLYCCCCCRINIDHCTEADAPAAYIFGSARRQLLAVMSSERCELGRRDATGVLSELYLQCSL